ncbi:MAG: M1 family peptidase [Gemmatimonadetes bacterium]|nr:M1 family peptidase [Gemmatimonadota bacterium]
MHPKRSSVVRLLALVLVVGWPVAARAQGRAPTHADSLRGALGPERAWWDVIFYDLALRLNQADSSLVGSNAIHYRVAAPARELQIDLMTPLEVDSVVAGGARLAFRRDGNAFFVRPAEPQAPGSVGTLTVHYHGRPRVATNPPWDGGLVWTRDPRGQPWISSADQGLGASVFWPNKDQQADEPDSMRIRVTVPSTLVEVSNGRLAGATTNPDGTTTYDWRVRNPINNYGVTVNAGSYVHFGERFDGEAGALDLDYWVLAAHLADARRQFVQVQPMLACFESWFGPYPFYEDGYKLVEAPYLGMEHQSAVAYGNGFRNGYRGSDLSATGLGLSWDYIIVHESAHEWWGNSVTTKDIADMWVHEAFAMYAEGLFVECTQGKEAGARYLMGVRGRILNDEPMVGPYGVNREGSGDMYFKGANVLHTIRQLVDDDARWREILRGLQATYRHQTVTSAQIEGYLSRAVGRDLSRIFDQYLRRTKPPTLEYAYADGAVRYRWRADVDGFDLPVRVAIAPGRWEWIEPTTGSWKTRAAASVADFVVDKSFYVAVAELKNAP